MKAIICKKVYDTDTAQVVKKYTNGNLGDTTGYEETLYVTEEGLYFEYVNGGVDSVHPQEKIKRVAKNAVEKWISDHE